jgi:putative ABC transport system permease protein
MLFRVLPYQDPDRLVLLRSCGADGECYGSFPSILAFEGRKRLTTIADFAVAAMPGTYSASPEATGERPVRFTGVSSNLLQVLGVQPALGRNFTDEDAQLKRRVAVISFEAWHTRFGGATDVLGRELWGRPAPVTIVGVLPKGFIPPTWTRPDPTWDGLVLERA